MANDGYTAESADYLNDFIKDLLHLEDGTANRLLHLGDLSCAQKSLANSRTFLLNLDGGNTGARTLAVIRERRGKPANRTILHNSSLAKIADAGLATKWEWKDLNGETSVQKLHAFISDYHKDLNLKGNNPLFMGVGSLRWKIVVSGDAVEVDSPVLIFPVRLIRGAETSPVEVEFVDDEAYFNPCLIALMRDLYPNVAENFPHPNGEGADFDDALDLTKLGDGAEYFDKVEEHLSGCSSAGGGELNGVKFALSRDTVALALYNHSDICMYYDVRRNREKIEKSSLVARVFGRDMRAETPPVPRDMPAFVLPHDSVQKELITRVAGGESLIIKGPPGTGKTLTIANMIAALIARGKRVMFASKKLSALAEVNNKLPENLRKCVLELAYETERQAADVRPETIKEEFRDILRYKREYTADNNLFSKLYAARTARDGALSSLEDYYAKMFGGDLAIAGKSYYEALDEFYMNPDLPVLKAGGDFPDIDAVKLEQACTAAEEAGRHFAALAGERPAAYSPWFNARSVSDGEEKIYPAYEQICGKLPALFGELEKAFKERADGMTLGMACLSGNTVFDDLASAEAVFAAYTKESKAELEEKLKTLEERGGTFGINFAEEDRGVEDFVCLAPDGEVTREEIQKMADGAFLVLRGGDAPDEASLSKLVEALKNVRLKRGEATKNKLEAAAVFDAPLTQKQRDMLFEAGEKAGEYLKESKPSFGRKRLFKKLSALSSDKLVTPEKLFGAVVSYRAYIECENSAAQTQRLIGIILGADAATLEEHCPALALALERSESAGLELSEYLKRTEGAARALAGSGVELPPDIKAGEVIAAYRLFSAQKELEKRVLSLFEKAGAEVPKAPLKEVAKAVISLFSLAALLEERGLEKDVRSGILRGLFDLSPDCGRRAGEIAALFGSLKEYIDNYYTKDPAVLTVGDLKYFASKACDRAAAGAAVRYSACISALGALFPAGQFFKKVESGEYAVKPERFGDYLKRNYLYNALLRRSGAGGMGGDAGRNAEVALDIYSSAEEDILRLNAQFIEKEYLTSIDPDDPDFAFLAGDKGVKYSLRGMFRTYASAILKLKRCFILSPSSASVLFRSPLYEEFDAVIVDEASQLEPVYLLPLLYRCRQCVLVGDEYQMPPITHFKAKRAAIIRDYDRELTLDKNVSALSLALSSGSFGYAELVCHYRSKTESLIAFSQREFYPHMRTFPAAKPFGEGLGFRDIYVEKAICDGGINAVEADKTVELLKEHFEKYFDGEAGALKEGGSVGVVAFGEAQLAAIRSRVERDGELYDRIRRAESAADVPEKAVFFRTIESVQGQETDHLILSLTYGVDKNGKPQNRFGELNRDDFGKCIFNVAVTRARSSVTLVHSILPHELDGSSRIAFIIEYMRLAKKFSEGGRSQFTGSPFETGEGFIDDVARYLVSLGVDPARIVRGYGVTEGSVKIPIAVLSPDLSEAVLGIWCELPTGKKYNYIDYNLLYFDSLAARNWNLHRIPVNGWFFDNEAEKNRLKDKILKIL